MESKETFEITRRLEIDAGHRVPDHKSKCFNIHGHRYIIEATCEGEYLFTEGEQKGMLLDFGFLKDEMVKEIEFNFDHRMILSVHDPTIDGFLHSHSNLEEIEEFVKEESHAMEEGFAGGLTIIEDSPTAENLAKLWFHMLMDKIEVRSNSHAHLKKITVHETPNCFAVYSRKRAN